MVTVVEVRIEPQIVQCAEVLRRSFGTVAAQYGLTVENAPTNPAFVTVPGLREYLAKPVSLFALMAEERMIGCVAIERSKVSEDTYYVERLAVLPEERHRGYGEQLLHFAMDRIRDAGGCVVSLGLMNENAVLKRWYQRYGFAETGRRRFEHLPFEVCFMSRRVR